MRVGLLCAGILALAGCAHAPRSSWFDDVVDFRPAATVEFIGTYHVWLHVDFGGHNKIVISEDGRVLWDYERIGDLVDEHGELDYTAFSITGRWEAIDAGRYRLRFEEDGPAHARVFECRLALVDGKRGFIVAADGVALAERVEETEGFHDVFLKDKESRANQRVEINAVCPQGNPRGSLST